MSLWNDDIASVMLAQGKLSDAQACVCRALTIGRAMRNAPCVGLALVALGNLRIAQAKANEQARAKDLSRAKRTLHHALALQGLEVEARVRGQLALAEVSLLMGETGAARNEAIKAMGEALTYDLAGVFKDCERLLGEIG